jgi:ribose/xylose/arabinose/galactoside ABC-type transport system permease subunit
MLECVLMSQSVTTAAMLVHEAQSRSFLGAIGHGIVVLILVIFFIGLVIGLVVGFLVGRLFARRN